VVCFTLPWNQSLQQTRDGFTSTRPSSTKLLSRDHFHTRDQARRAVTRFIDAYNHRRRHSSCGMLPPATYEQLLAHRAAEAAEQSRAA
jgi:transposase InsO family protein